MSQLSAATTEHDPVTCPQCHQNSERASVEGYIGGQCRPTPAKAWLGVYGWYPYTSSEKDSFTPVKLDIGDYPKPRGPD